jgi:hypothetical protein
VQSSDKLYGTFNFGNLNPGGTTVVFSSNGLQNSITFVNPNFIGGTFQLFGFEVEVNQGPNFIIQQRADVIQTTGTSMLMQTTTPAGSPMIDFMKTDNVVSGDNIANFSAAQNVTDLTVDNRFIRLIDSDATAVETTFVQQVPEPASVETLVVALAGLAFGYRNLKSRRS